MSSCLEKGEVLLKEGHFAEALENFNKIENPDLQIVKNKIICLQKLDRKSDAIHEILNNFNENSLELQNCLFSILNKSEKNKIDFDEFFNLLIQMLESGFIFDSNVMKKILEQNFSVNLTSFWKLLNLMSDETKLTIFESKKMENFKESRKLTNENCELFYDFIQNFEYEAQILEFILEDLNSDNLIPILKKIILKFQFGDIKFLKDIKKKNILFDDLGRLITINILKKNESRLRDLLKEELDKTFKVYLLNCIFFVDRDVLHEFCVDEVFLGFVVENYSNPEFSRLIVNLLLSPEIRLIFQKHEIYKKIMESQVSDSDFLILARFSALTKENLKMTIEVLINRNIDSSILIGILELSFHKEFKIFLLNDENIWNYLVLKNVDLMVDKVILNILKNSIKCDDDDDEEEMQEELKQLKNLFNKNQNFGDEELAKKICKKIKEKNLIQSICENKNFEIVAEFIELMVKRDVEIVLVLAKYGAIDILIKTIQNKKENTKKLGGVLSKICISLNSNLLSYPMRCTLIPIFKDLMQSESEFLIYEATMALTNLASIPDEVLIHQNCWESFSNVLTSSNINLQRVAVEGLCNLCLNQEIQTRICNNKYEFELKVLRGFLLDDDIKVVSAATGGIAMLLNTIEISEILLKLDILRYITKCYLNNQHNENIKTRLIIIMEQMKLYDNTNIEINKVYETIKP